MGMYPNMTTFFSISGPAYDVIKALTTAEFTPKKNFKGVAEVTIEYGMPPNSLRRVYQYPKGSKIPRRSLVVKIHVGPGKLPASPILIHPHHFCSGVANDGIIPLNMVEIRGRYNRDEMVKLSIFSQKGVIQQNMTARYKCPPVRDDESPTSTMCLT
ncbi:uncharacterized protein [Amphiura filiformis]|uniref:uncharacterized protein n=1 Tax=Amphiura filiformis TaxID=82378 RepID=UPI003B21C050